MEQSGLLLERATLERQIKAGANWFYWIAGLSLVNTVILLLLEGDTVFIVGLGATRIIDGIALIYNDPSNSSLIMEALFADLVISSIFIFFGIMSNKRYKWAFIFGMILYALDALILIKFEDFASMAFHAFALFCIYKGFSNSKRLDEIENQLSRSMNTYGQGYVIGEGPFTQSPNNYNTYNENTGLNNPGGYAQNNYSNQDNFHNQSY